MMFLERWANRKRFRDGAAHNDVSVEGSMLEAGKWPFTMEAASPS
jgi:hypothetical protein